MDLLEPWDPLDHPPRIEIRRQDSDDSDAEGGLGNVTRMVVRPPGHSGKAKRGHLSFDASFETGNLGRVDFISEFEYDLFVRPDTCNPRHRLWFNFVVDNVREDQRVLFNIVNFSKPRNLFCNGMTPLVKTSSRPRWQRLGEKYVYYHKSPEHRNHYILSFAFVFDRENDVYQFALTFPYSYARLELHLKSVRQKNFPFLSIQTLARSLQNRKVRVYSICNPTLLEKKPKVILVLSRIHPGESPTSYVTQGLVDFLLSTHPLAIILRDHVLIKVIPMVCPDGVFNGNQRTSLMGYDLNRHWNKISSFGQPVLFGLQNYFQELDRDKNAELDMVLDLHAHTSLLGAFIYGNSYEDVYRFERHILFPKLLAHNAEDYSPTYSMYNRDPHKVGTARRHLCDTLRTAINVYTLQVSAYGFTKQVNGLTRIVPYNEDLYFRLGRNLARTIAEYYRVTGVISHKLFAGVLPPDIGIEEEIQKKRLVRRSRSRSKSKPRSVDDSKRDDGDDISRKAESCELIGQDSNLDASDESSEEHDSDAKSSPPRILARGHSIALEESDDQQEDPLWCIPPVAKRSPETKFEAEPSGKFAFRTFDFSVITTEDQRSIELNGAVRGRKVGGGGFLGKPIREKLTNTLKWSEARDDSKTPSLTIIDFNELIRLGVAQRRKEVQFLKTGYHSRKELTHKIRRSRGHRSEGSACDDTTSDSECERQFVLKKCQTSSPTLPLDGTRTFVQHEKMQLNPRDEQRRQTRVRFKSFEGN